MQRFTGMFSNPGEYVIALTEFHRDDEWIETFTLSAFDFMLQSKKSSIELGCRFSKKYYAVHSSRLMPKCSSRWVRAPDKNGFSDIDCPSMSDDATISNIVWLVKKLTDENTTEPLRKFEKCKDLLICTQWLTSRNERILDSYDGTLAVAVVIAGIIRQC